MTQPGIDFRVIGIIRQMIADRHDFRLRQIVLKKSFSADERNFSEPPMRFAHADVKDHIVSNKSDQRPSYRRYDAS